MAILKWGNSFKDLLSMHNKMDNFLEPEASDMFQKNEGEWTPPVDIYENDDEVVITAELPGVECNDVDIKVLNNTLSIEGNKKPLYDNKEGNIYRLECPYGKFKRSFSLANTIDKDKIKASFKDGILKITLPKENVVSHVKIDIESED